MVDDKNGKPLPMKAPEPVFSRRELAMSAENVARMENFVNKPSKLIGESAKSMTSASTLKKRLESQLSLKRKTKSSDESVGDKYVDHGSYKRNQFDRDRNLGPLSRYGDGDGSYWDRWLVFEPPNRSSYAAGMVQPMSGYKRFDITYNESLENRRRPATGAVRSTRYGRPSADIRGMPSTAPPAHGRPTTKDFRQLTPSMRRLFANMELETEGSDEVKAKTEVLGLDEGSSDSDFEEDEGRVLVGSKSTPLPAVRLSPIEKKKYFGNAAVWHLFHTYRQMSSSTREMSDQFATLPCEDDLTMEQHRLNSMLYDPEEVKSLPSPYNRSASERQAESAAARMTFLKQCAELDVAPEPIIIRKHKSSSLKIPHYGIGDKVGSALASSLGSLPNVQHLDLQDNRLTESAVVQTVRALSGSNRLLSINLGQNRVGLSGFREIASFLRETVSLTKINLSRTKMGDRDVRLLADALTLQKTVIDIDLSHNELGSNGGTYIAQILEENHTVTRLNLEWNVIRLAGAVAIGKAMELNQQLRFFNLAWNGFADHGCRALGHSMRINHTLRLLDLSHNSCTGHAAMVIAGALSHNRGLTSLQLNGNVLGKQGGRALMRAVNQMGDVRDINLENCNFEVSCSDVFDSTEPAGVYALDTTDPYDLAVAEECLRLCNTKPGCDMTEMKLKTGRKTRRIKLSRMEIDEDGPDDDGVQDYVDPTSGKLWEVPRKGLLSFKFVFKRLAPVASQAVGASGLQNMLEMIQGKKPEGGGGGGKESNRRGSVMEGGGGGGGMGAVSIIALAADELYFKADQAATLLESIENLQGNARLDAVASLLPRLVDPENSWAFIQKNVGLEERKLLEGKLGPMFRFNASNATGHYVLDLAKKNERNLAEKLMEINNDDRTWVRRKSGRQDTSQKGNWSSFRNETYEGQPITLNQDYIIPTSGKLELDFVSQRVAKASQHPMTEERFCELLQEIGLLSGAELDSYLPEDPIAVAAAAAAAAAAEADEGSSIERARSPTAASSTVVALLAEGGGEEGAEPEGGGEEGAEPDFPSVTTPRAKAKKAAGGGKSKKRSKKSMLTADAPAASKVLNPKALKRLSDKLLDWRAALSNTFLTVSQARRALDCVPHSVPLLRIEAIVSMFSRLVDIRNFDEIIAQEAKEVRDALWHRLGLLNIWNPCKPDGPIELRLFVREERKVAEMLVVLAVKEDGENWQNETYKPHGVDEFPGWELGKSWIKDVPKSGVLYLEYCSDPAQGCKAEWDIREELQLRVMCGSVGQRGRD